MLCKERGAKAALSDRPFQPDPASRQTLQSGVFRPRFLGKRAFTSLPKTPRPLLLSLYKRAALFPPAGGLRKPPPKAAESVLFPPARGPRKPLPKGGGSLLVLPQKRGEGPSLFPPAGGPRKPPCFSQKEGLEILLTSSLFRPLSCPLGRAFFPAFLSLLCKKSPGSSLSPPVKISSGLREGRAARKIPGLSSGFRLRVFRPACGGSGLYRRNVRTRSVKFSVRPAVVQAYPACGAYRRMKKETGESPVSFGFGWGGGAKRGDRAGLPFSFGSEALSPRRRSFGRPRRPPDRPPTTGRGGPR